MSKRPKAAVASEGVADESESTVVETKKFATSVPRTIINGHVLTVGTVVALTQEEADSHRSHGMQLDDVKDDDNREVYDVSQPFVAEGNGAE